VLHTSKPGYRWLPWAIIGLVLLAVLGYLSLGIGWVESLPSVWQAVLGFGLVTLLLAAAVVIALQVARLLDQQRRLQQKVSETDKVVGEVYQRLAAVFSMREQFSEAESEREIIELLLSQSIALTGASGASFVALDEHRHPLPAISQGRPPVTLPDAWIEYLASPVIRSRCSACDKHNQLVTTCPLLSGPFSEAAGLYCIPLRRAEREFGVLNIYIPDQNLLDLETRAFLTSLVEETSHALETIWLRKREFESLRKLQAVRQKSELNSLLANLLENIYNSLEPDFALLVLNDKFSLEKTFEQDDGKMVRDEFSFGELPSSSRPLVLSAVRNVLSSGAPENIQLPAWEGNLNTSVRAILAVPLLAAQQTEGAIVIGSHRAAGFNQRQVSLLNTVAGQIALVVHSANQLAELEYKTMIDERTRLAREIHDGLAQTLGFLKLQVAQMQNYLERGDLDKLKQGITLYYQTLSEAYQDARYAIDGLRISPAGSRLEEWLQQMLEEFQEDFDQQAFSVTVDCYNLSMDLPSEIQAQLIRIVQEALSNVRKHAGARSVQVRCQEVDGDLVFEIEDDGRGFSSEDVPGPSKHGLRGMRERAELIGADFQVISQAGRGTVVRVSLPVSVGEIAS
jgi:two-component system, NarL family, nitrate/nitrite sensor histidine kinase NarX